MIGNLNYDQVSQVVEVLRKCNETLSVVPEEKGVGGPPFSSEHINIIKRIIFFYLKNKIYLLIY